MRTSTFFIYALGVVAMALMGLALVYSFAKALDMPEVHVSYSTKECVAVDDPAAEHEGREPYTCNRLPKKYRHVWVY